MWQGCVVEMELESVGGSRTVRTEDTRIREEGGGVASGLGHPLGEGGRPLAMIEGC